MANGLIILEEEFKEKSKLNEYIHRVIKVRCDTIKATQQCKKRYLSIMRFMCVIYI